MAEPSRGGRAPEPGSRLRPLLVAGYVAIAALGFVWPWQPRVFWTMALPALVLFIVLGGFHRWRRLCPLAWFGSLGQRASGSQRRVPAWMERAYPLLSLGFLASMLVLRLVATNGDGRWLAGLLIGLALAAAATNFVFTGKTWCNFLCPVGVVERIYTDPRSLRPDASSQCATCTACKRACPDIDQENNYWRELAHGSRRVATYAFPGVVLAFYGYFWLRHGDWETYFDGRWTSLPADAVLAFGPGFFFAPSVPALAAAILSFLVLAALSWAAFRGLELAVGRLVDDEERRLHLMLSAAAFTAFSLFYVFAGAPTLRRIPYGTRGFAFLAPIVATLVLVGRWRRTREGYVRDKAAAKLLAHWPLATPPPADPSEAYALFRATEQARETVLEGYTQTLREILRDGIVRDGERRLLEEVRKQFGIDEKEHARVVGELEAELRERLEAGEGAGVEARAQREGYEAAVTEAFLRDAPAGELEELRLEFGVDEAAHARLLARLRDRGGVLENRLRRSIDALETRVAERLRLAAGPPSEARDLVVELMSRAETKLAGQVVDLLAGMGDAAEVRLCKGAVLCGNPARREAGIRRLADLCPEAAGEIARLGAARAPKLGPAEAEEAEILERLGRSTDPYLRAAALWLEFTLGGDGLTEALDRASADPVPIVAATADALRARAANGRGDVRSPIERLAFLRRVPLFSELDPADLEELAAFAREEIVEPSAALCLQGVPDSGDLMVLLEGRAAVTVRSDPADASTERRVAELGPHEVVGELSLLDGSPRSATVRPDGGPVRLLRVPGPPFRDRLLRREAVSRSLLATLSERLRGLTGRIAGGS